MYDIISELARSIDVKKEWWMHSGESLATWDELKSRLQLCDTLPRQQISQIEGQCLSRLRRLHLSKSDRRLNVLNIHGGIGNITLLMTMLNHRVVHMLNPEDAYSIRLNPHANFTTWRVHRYLDRYQGKILDDRSVGWSHRSNNLHENERKLDLRFTDRIDDTIEMFDVGDVDLAIYMEPWLYSDASELELTDRMLHKGSAAYHFMASKFVYKNKLLSDTLHARYRSMRYSRAGPDLWIR